MTHFEYRGLQTSYIYVENSGDTYHVAASARFVTSSTAIVEADGVSGNSYVIDGRIVSGSDVLNVNSPAAVIVIGETARLQSGNTAVTVEGPDSEVANSGIIKAKNQGIAVYGDHSLARNDGYIGARYGLWGSGDGVLLINGRAGEILSDHAGFDAYADTGEQTRMVNHGLVTAATYAAVGGNSDDTLRNDGTMIGDIDLLEGNDTIDLRGGAFRGQIHGGQGDDRLRTDNAGYHMTEDAGGGRDVVYSSVTYRLNANVEALLLTGSKDINGFGTAQANAIAGNTGDNILRGGGGSDVITGLGGNDRLFGGADADIFDFGNQHGRDTVEDFVQGVDMIYLDQWLPKIGFQTILDHTHDTAQGAMIEFGRHSITIIGLDKAELAATDLHL